MARNALLGGAAIVVCAVGLVIGIVRLAPGRGAGDFVLAGGAALVGAAAFAVLVRVGRRGMPAWSRWVYVAVLASALFANRLSSRDQFALLALGCGYVAAFVVTIAVRVMRLR